MITLDLTTKKLELVLGAAHTTNALEACVFYYDVPRQAIDRYTEFLPGSFLTTSNGTTTVTLLAAPDSLSVRNVTDISVYNKDTIEQSVTVKVDYSATDYIIVKAPLRPGESLLYNKDGGWQII